MVKTEGAILQDIFAIGCLQRHIGFCSSQSISDEAVIIERGAGLQVGQLYGLLASK